MHSQMKNAVRKRALYLEVILRQSKRISDGDRSPRAPQGFLDLCTLCHYSRFSF